MQTFKPTLKLKQIFTRSTWGPLWPWGPLDFVHPR